MFLRSDVVLDVFKESRGSHGNFYEGEQEQCCSVPVGALYGGLRISGSAGHVLASLWLEPLVSQGRQEVFLVIVLRDSIL